MYETFLQSDECNMTTEQKVQYASKVIRNCLNMVEYSLADPDPCVDLYLSNIEEKLGDLRAILL